MALNFRIVFSGICAFAPFPNGSFDEPANRKDFFKKVSVVLPSMLEASEVGNRVRDGHVPTLELDRSQGWTGDRDVDLVAPKRQARKDVYFLNKERVWFEIGGGEQGGVEVLNFDKKPAQPPEAPLSAEQARFFWWVPKMERVAPGTEALDQGLLRDADNVASVVEIHRGLFSVPDGSISFSPVDFRPVGGTASGVRQKIAFRVAVDVKQVTSVRIFFQTLDENQPPKTRSLLLNDEGGDVEIAIKNREVHDLLGVPVPKAGLGSGVDVDFQTYYDLSSNRSITQKLVPHGPEVDTFSARAVMKADPLGLSLGGVCPPTAFSARGDVLTAAPSADEGPRRVLASEVKAAKRVRSRR
ncbi:MAG TPA: hypothetical protein VH394_10250 [Thermoanaerobaculia bacterium]|jgi:hypothetical protein|nr:hypothetical protein [Thermoanaerobaculia bacterium]